MINEQINLAFIINIIYLQRMSSKLLLILLAGLIINTFSFSVAPKTPESLAKSFKKFDQNNDYLLSQAEAKKYFDQEYMSDFAGIDIDPKFIESAFNHLLNGDKDNDNFLSEEQFVDNLTPKQQEKGSREPRYYSEQDL